MPEGYLHLTCEQRCQIYALLQSGHSQAHIARQIGVDPSTISRECRIRTDHAPANFTTIKHMAQNLIRKAPGKDSLRLRRKTAAWDDDFLASLLAA